MCCKDVFLTRAGTVASPGNGTVDGAFFLFEILRQNLNQQHRNRDLFSKSLLVHFFKKM